MGFDLDCNGLECKGSYGFRHSFVSLHKGNDLIHQLPLCHEEGGYLLWVVDGLQVHIDGHQSIAHKLAPAFSRVKALCHPDLLQQCEPATVLQHSSIPSGSPDSTRGDRLRLSKRVWACRRQQSLFYPQCKSKSFQGVISSLHHVEVQDPRRTMMTSFKFMPMSCIQYEA